MKDRTERIYLAVSVLFLTMLPLGGCAKVNREEILNHLHEESHYQIPIDGGLSYLKREDNSIVDQLLDSAYTQAFLYEEISLAEVIYYDASDTAVLYAYLGNTDSPYLSQIKGKDTEEMTLGEGCRVTVSKENDQIVTVLIDDVLYYSTQGLSIEQINEMITEIDAYKELQQYIKSAAFVYQKEMDDFLVWFNSYMQNEMMQYAEGLLDKRKEYLSMYIGHLKMDARNEDDSTFIAVLVYNLTDDTKANNCLITVPLKGESGSWVFGGREVTEVFEVDLTSLASRYASYELTNILYLKGATLQATGRVQVQVDQLRLRSRESLSSPIIGHAENGRSYPVYEVIQNDDYTWYWLGYDYGYIASKEGEWTLYQAN